MNNVIRYKGFKGFFVMKKNEQGKWEYLSYYWRRGKTSRLSFADNEVRYFADTTIEKGTAWTAFDCVRHAYPNSQVILYVKIDGRIERVKWYNPYGEKKITVWHEPIDYYCFAPRKDLSL